MFKQKSFPLQQGAVDSLCAVYSILNCMHVLGELDSCIDAESRFRAMARKLERPVDALLEGFDPGDAQESDINWLAWELSERRLLNDASIVAAPVQLRALLENSGLGGIIFFHDARHTNLTHYTFVESRSQADGAFRLWDSYGFERLVLLPDQAMIDGEAVVITHFWAARPQS